MQEAAQVLEIRMLLTCRSPLNWSFRIPQLHTMPVFIISIISRIQTYIALNCLKVVHRSRITGQACLFFNEDRFQSGSLLIVHLAAVRGNPSTDDAFKSKLFSVPFFKILSEQQLRKPTNADKNTFLATVLQSTSGIHFLVLPTPLKSCSYRKRPPSSSLWLLVIIRTVIHIYWYYFMLSLFQFLCAERQLHRLNEPWAYSVYILTIYRRIYSILIFPWNSQKVQKPPFKHFQLRIKTKGVSKRYHMSNMILLKETQKYIFK